MKDNKILHERFLSRCQRFNKNIKLVYILQVIRIHRVSLYYTWTLKKCQPIFFANTEEEITGQGCIQLTCFEANWHRYIFKEIKYKIHEQPENIEQHSEHIFIKRNGIRNDQVKNKRLLFTITHAHACRGVKHVCRTKTGRMQELFAYLHNDYAVWNLLSR